ncbi:MAG: LytTR family DNA-binding domain-containing protein [Acidobacteriia bacterium]|nr:LytTR family DNA-binding domain-containing protein [Terriglobia bacterium]
MRILIVDDEPLACERIRTLLAGQPGIEIAGECHDGKSAVAAMCDLAPDLVFLDVQMPEMDGFAVLERVERAAMPVVIFVTAFDQYAIKAFEVCALDYLLKPFDRERFRKALARGRMEFERRSAGDLGARLRSVLEEWRGRKRYLDRLVIRSGGRVFFLRVDELDWVEAAGNYVRLHAGAEEYLHRETLSRLEAALDPDRFARIHRSAIVNVGLVKELHPMFRGDYAVILRDGRRLTLSRAYRDRLRI